MDCLPQEVLLVSTGLAARQINAIRFRENSREAVDPAQEGYERRFRRQETQ